MNKVVFERLVQAVGRRMRDTDAIKRLRTPVGESVLMGVWVLFNQDTFRSEGLNMDASTSKIHRHYLRLIKALFGIGTRYIKWPAAQQRHESAPFYQRKFGFLGAVLSIDSTLVKMTAPSEQKQRYVDRHHNYSINTQIVCDHKRLIRDVYVGQPGSVNDARVFKRSAVAKHLYSRQDMLNRDEHIVGDCAYVNTTKILSPYKDYNALSQCRATVERVNGLLKARMGRLWRLHCKKIERVIYHIMASCVLYNFILLEGQDMDGIVLGDPPNIDVAAAITALDAAGRAKRQRIRFLLEESDSEDD